MVVTFLKRAGMSVEASSATGGRGTPRSVVGYPFGGMSVATLPPATEGRAVYAGMRGGRMAPTRCGMDEVRQRGRAGGRGQLSTDDMGFLVTEEQVWSRAPSRRRGEAWSSSRASGRLVDEFQRHWRESTQDLRGFRLRRCVLRATTSVRLQAGRLPPTTE